MPKRDATDMPGSLTPEERAALVATAAVGYGMPEDAAIVLGSMVLAAIRAAVAEEREACAKAAEAYDRENFCAYGCAEHVAEAIRSRPS